MLYFYQKMITNQYITFNKKIADKYYYIGFCS